MAAGILSSKPGAASKKVVHLPTKQTINLMAVGVKTVKLNIAIPAIILIALAAAAFSKFFILDRFQQLANAQAEVRQIRTELAAANKRLEGFDEVNEKYAHYTYSGMTNEELTRVTRSDVIALVQRVIIPEVIVDNWSVSGNQLNLNIVGKTLQEINLLAQKLNEEDIVDFCTVRTAATTDINYQTREEEEMLTETDVTAQITVYLVAQEKKEA